MKGPIISERAIDEPRPLKVIYIGAGISGILASIQFPQHVPGLDLVVYEKNSDLGGTWLENRLDRTSTPAGLTVFLKPNSSILLGILAVLAVCSYADFVYTLASLLPNALTRSSRYSGASLSAELRIVYGLDFILCDCARNPPILAADCRQVQC